MKLPLTILLLLHAFVVQAQKPKKNGGQLPVKQDEFICGGRMETGACFLKGDKGWKQFLEKHLSMDSLANEAHKPGGCQTILLRFVVERDGRLSNISVSNADTVHAGYVAEALRVIHLSPRWKPAMQNGRPVKSYRQQPITFCTEAEDSTEAPAANITMVRAVFAHGADSLQPWFSNQLQKNPTLLPYGGRYPQTVDVRFILYGNTADSLQFSTGDLPPLLQKELSRLIQTPGIWKAVLPKRTVSGRTAPVITYLVSIEIAPYKSGYRPFS